MDRNFFDVSLNYKEVLSLSARRAWIEIISDTSDVKAATVALRKESVDRNSIGSANIRACTVALRKESVDRNDIRNSATTLPSSRSPQGERG